MVVTPEYNHSYPASLKAAIDWHFTQWTAKPVAFVSYGGAAGGRHAVLHLENVLTELHAVTIRDGLAFPNYYRLRGRPPPRPAGGRVRQGHVRPARLVGHGAPPGPGGGALPGLTAAGQSSNASRRREAHTRLRSP